METSFYYDIRETIKEAPQATHFYIVGQGGVGKTFSIKRLLMLNFLYKGERFIYVRRWREDTKAKYMDTVFNDLLARDQEVQQALIDKYGDHDFIIYSRSGAFALGYLDDKGKVKVLDKDMGIITSVSEGQRFKGTTYPGYTSIFFDEFISKDGYNGGRREPEFFQLILGTVARRDNPARVFYAGNPDGQIELCPYLDTLHLDYKAMQANTPYIYDRKYYMDDQIRIQAGGIVFLKLAKYKGRTFLDAAAAGTETAEAAIRATGERPDIAFPLPSESVKRAFKARLLLSVELPIIVEDKGDQAYRKRVYLLLGKLEGTNLKYAGILYAHRPPDKVVEVVSRWEERPLLNTEAKAQIYRLNFTHDLTQIKNCIQYIIEAHSLFSDQWREATWFLDLYKEAQGWT